MKAIKVFIIALLCCLFFTNSAVASSQVIGQYEIPFSQATTPESAINACIAGMYLNQTVIDPGEVFSFNRTIGIRTPERYFIPAPIASLSKTPIYKYGGGICMTASILHQAVKNAGLEVIERHNHVTEVNYLPLGEDAAITWGVEDYRFKNTLNNPVRINVIFTDYSLRIEINEEKA
ncbi:MAG TPA: VanW family protein [Acetivibrio sp.]|nr:VanW family protein [Acetivibrio sp.]HQD91534.1 VanW family protein [Syntrophomonadaceae bacterium]